MTSYPGGLRDGLLRAGVAREREGRVGLRWRWIAKALVHASPNCCKKWTVGVGAVYEWP